MNNEKELNKNSEDFSSNFDIDIKGKMYSESPEVKDVLDKVLEKEKMEIEPAEVGCMMVYPNISKKRAAQIKRANPVTEFYSGNQYILKVSGEIWDMLDDETRYVLIYHQVLRIDTQYNEKRGEWKFKLRPTEYNDFYAINEKFGSTWQKTVQSTASSLYDLDPAQESKVKV